MIYYHVSMKATVSEKGQVTIPKKLRDRLGISAGQVLDFTEEKGRLMAQKVIAEDPVERVYGVLGLALRTDQLIEEMRGTDRQR